MSSVSYHNTVKSGHRRVEGGGHPEREGWERTGQDRTGQDWRMLVYQDETVQTEMLADYVILYTLHQSSLLDSGFSFS